MKTQISIEKLDDQVILTLSNSSEALYWASKAAYWLPGHQVFTAAAVVTACDPTPFKRVGLKGKVAN